MYYRYCVLPVSLRAGRSPHARGKLAGDIFLRLSGADALTGPNTGTVRAVRRAHRHSRAVGVPEAVSSVQT